MQQTPKNLNCQNTKRWETQSTSMMMIVKGETRGVLVMSQTCPCHNHSLSSSLAFRCLTLPSPAVPCLSLPYPVSRLMLFTVLLTLPTNLLQHHLVLLTAIPMLSASKLGSSFILLPLLLYLSILLP